ncbi:MAG: MAPEG family protein [Pseudomonadota bacterium]|nr:MAPEG family protein [Pseudomonadota bacterium]MEC7961364.1 MAPEG family protein [Pseudomonadota bacterium]MEC8019493.1 MAPEG family protein [Pseudomonadota bacterium]MEC8797527.1 MAPEG family protein [Pseudomonadota bacterium]
MNDFVYPGILSSIALLVYYFTLLRAGMARVKFDIKAPSHDGPEEYVRHVRVHHNTLEHLILFLPGLWLFSFAVDPVWATIIGILWPIGRIRYALSYYKDAEKRGPGLYLSMPPIYIYVLGSFIAFLYKIIT